MGTRVGSVALPFAAALLAAPLIGGPATLPAPEYQRF